MQLPVHSLCVYICARTCIQTRKYTYMYKAQQMNHGALNKTRPRCLASAGVLMAALSELLPYLECSKNI